MIRYSLITLLLGVVINTSAQEEAPVKKIAPKKVVLMGIGYDTENLPLNNLLIINQRTLTGVFGRGNGKYEITVLLDDEIKFGAYGYNSKVITPRSIGFESPNQKDTIYYNPVLTKLSITLSEATVIAPRELNEIHKEIQTLGYNEKDYKISGLNAAQSPITFLYQQFSEREKRKRKVIEMENDDMKRDLLKELLARYANFEIVDLTSEEFDDFIDFLNVSDNFIKNASQYEFIVFVKNRFLDYQKYRKKEIEMLYDDYDYDRD